MLAWLRRSRALALVLLSLTPGLAGVGLQAVHPCPVDLPWAEGGAAPHDAVHGDAAGHQGDHGAGEHCHCIGGCLGGSAATLPLALAIVTLAVEPGAPAPAPASALERPTDRPTDRLPFSTPPPIA
ncbi:MAG TPA: hypothetical protein VNK43_03190 [Gemmatimonadales bacterium]|nr:hypothetical protein [Gemmatimonadales bacterium]